MLSAAIVHPDMKAVIPLNQGPMLRQDNSEKNVCEFNAFKRFASKFRKDHPKPTVVL